MSNEKIIENICSFSNLLTQLQRLASFSELDIGNNLGKNDEKYHLSYDTYPLFSKTKTKLIMKIYCKSYLRVHLIVFWSL